MKQLYFSVLLMITVLQCLCQPEIEYPVCSIDDKPVPPRIIAAQAVDLTSNNVLRDYLREIKSKLLLNHAPFFLKNIQERKTACALNLKNGNVIERVIALNEAYYSLLVPNTRLSKATFVWIIGHEITHHINSDHFYLSEKDALKNISKEVLCDENAGYLVGALTSDVSLNDVATILNSILRNNDTSMYYPPLKYRIHAAQAGWLRAKTEMWTESQTAEILGMTVSKTIEGTGTKQNIFLSAKFPNDSMSIVRHGYENGNAYFGPSHVQKGRLGHGIHLSKFGTEIVNEVLFGYFSDGFPKMATEITQTTKYVGSFEKWDLSGKGEQVYANGDHYVGYFKEGQRTGFGIYFFSNNATYVGEFLNNERHGFGVYYEGDRVIKEGCWAKGQLIEPGCKLKK